MLKVFFPLHLITFQYATFVSPAQTSRSCNALIESASSSRVPCVCCSCSAYRRLMHPSEDVGDPFFNWRHISDHLRHTWPIPLSFLYFPSFVLPDFFLFFQLFFIHLLRAGKYSAAHLNIIYRKCNVTVFQ